MSNLKKLISLCAAGVYITVNQHRDYYQTVERFLEEQNFHDQNEYDPEIVAKMIETDTCVHLQFYPLTPVGFYSIYHYDVDLAIDIALKQFNDSDL